MAEQKSKRSFKVNFQDFLEKFPILDLPVTLTEDSIHDFSQNIPPLPVPLVEEFLIARANEISDEFTEYIPCFRIPKTLDFHALVYWKAGLMTYEYTLATFSKEGQLIAKQVIAGTKAAGTLLVRSVATIDEDWIIYIVGGLTALEDKNYEASSSKSISLQLLATGEIITLSEAGFDDEIQN